MSPSNHGLLAPSSRFRLPPFLVHFGDVVQALPFQDLKHLGRARPQAAARRWAEDEVKHIQVLASEDISLALVAVREHTHRY